MTPAELREALAALGWTQEEAAEQLAVGGGQPRISEYARGVREIPPYIASHLRTHLELEECQRGQQDGGQQPGEAPASAGEADQ